MQEEDYEVTVFTCPQCGGRLLSDDTMAATFCSFCGGERIVKIAENSELLEHTLNQYEFGEASVRWIS